MDYKSPKTIFALMKDKLPTEEDKALISKAFYFSKRAHEGQLRASGEPYFGHVVETAKNLARYGMDAMTISAGLLHDTIEDGKAKEAEVKKEFGKEIYFLVSGVTKLGKLKYSGRERHVESLRKFFVAVAEDFRVVMIKLADRLHNLQTLNYVKPEKQKRIALESLEVYAPLAHRLGIAKLKGEIEDAAFPYVYPKEFKEVTKLLEEKKETKEKIVKKVEKEIVRKLQSENIQVLKTSSRVKHKYSLWRKLQRHHMDIDKIYDILALRVIVPTIEDCYRALGIVHSMWKPFPERLKDYIALPKLNGYQSLHTTIFNGEGALIEVQIRTMEMHGLAEYGIASHFAYKEFINKNGKKKPTQDGKYAWIKQFQTIKNDNEKADAFMKDLKMDFFNDRIFIFTPKGDVLDLPADSSPIDFAYSIHTDIGDHCSGAIVNGKMVPLSKKLQNGDIVDIITKESSKPTSKWLDYVKTAIAKKHIKSKVGDNGFLASLWGRFRNQ